MSKRPGNDSATTAPAMTEPPPKKSKWAPEAATASSTAPTPAQIAALMAEKKREIAEKVARMQKNRPAVPPQTRSLLQQQQQQQLQLQQLKQRISAVQPPISAEELARRKQAEEYAKRRQTRIAVHNNRAGGDALADASAKRGLQMDVHPSLTLDSGQIGIRRHAGNVSTTPAAGKELKEREKPTGAAAPKATLPPQETTLSIAGTAHFDLNLAGGKYADGTVKPARTAPRSALKFVQQGKFVAQADKIRAEARLDEIRRSVQERVQKSGLEAEFDMVGDGAVVHDAVPDVEWWDLNFLPTGSYDDLRRRCLNLENTISTLVQHPAPIEPTFESATRVSNVMLTAKERKKVRRLRRLEEQKEKQEKIRLGLLPAEAAKVKLSNLMRVLGTEAVQDPTMVEKNVRDQMASRQLKHEQDNEARKLTAEERSAKHVKKFSEDTRLKVHVAVFRVNDVSHPSHRFKIDMNAQQNHLTGVCIVHNSNNNLVVVEGGPKGVARYKRLMMERIDWTQQVDTGLFLDSGAADSSSAPVNECQLVWEGLKAQANFRGFRFRQCPTEQKVKECLGPECISYWDLAKSYRTHAQK